MAEKIDDASIDAIVTDPPYGLGFMGKEWDALPPGREWADECLRVLKPGGHLLAMGGTRTWHRLAVAIEDAGFEIRDCLAWMYGSGFPKSHDVSKAIDKAVGAKREVVGRKGGRYATPKQDFRGGKHHSGADTSHTAIFDEITAPATDDAKHWQGWGTALKPAFEPVVMARKPFSGTVAANVLVNGTGAINVDGCRVGMTKNVPVSISKHRARAEGVYEGNRDGSWGNEQGGPKSGHDPNTGRWPANVLLDEEAAEILDAQSGVAKPNKGRTGKRGGNGFGFFDDEKSANKTGVWPSDNGGGASRFFYVAKASRSEREAGLDARNMHPTVKPVALMRWLVRLVAPFGGIVLDPFEGSGTTGIACALEGFNYIGIERDEESLLTAKARIAHWSAK